MTQKMKKENKTSQEKRIEQIFKNNRFLKKDDSLNFDCDSCGKCCRNQDILLNTYDILKLRREFGEITPTLIEKYIEVYPGSKSNLPVSLLKFAKVDNETSVCPFLRPAFHKEISKAYDESKSEEDFNKKASEIVKRNEEAGNTKELCSIHKNSPNVCKLYPLGRGFSKDTKAGKEEIKYFLTDKKELPCSEDCFKVKNKVSDYLKNNSMLDNELAKAEKKYNLLLFDFFSILSKAKDKRKIYNTLSLYLINFDLIPTVEKLDRLQVKFKTPEVIKRNETIHEIVNEVKKYRKLDTNILAKSLKNTATDKDLLDTFNHLISIYIDIKDKLTKEVC